MIPFVDIAAQHAEIAEEAEARVLATLRSGQYVGGPEVAGLETEFAAFCGAGYGVSVNSGTAALHVALSALGVGAGDEVVTVSHTFAATAEAIVATGAEPVFVDIDPDTYTMDPRQLEAAITPRTRAILPVHLYGQMAPMDEILAVAEAHDVPVVEDACQAHGASLHGRRAGSMGTVGCFSFYPSKNLGSVGEGGMVVTNVPELATRMRQLADHGQARRYEHDLVGYNYRLPAIQAAVLRVKLARLDAWNARRAAHAAAYGEALSDTGLALPAAAPGVDHVYHLYVVRTLERDALADALRDRGVATGLHYPIPVHLQPAFAGARTVGDLPHTVQAAREVLSLPMYPQLTLEQIEYVTTQVCALTRRPRAAAR